MTEAIAYPIDQWVRQYNCSGFTGRIRTQSSDFQVTENLGFELDGEGKHLWTYIRKTDCNTIDICNALSRAAEVHPKEIGVSGQKDRKAVTEQWFSILAEKNPADTLRKVQHYCDNQENITLIAFDFHKSKLKRGSHRSNSFRLVIRELSANRDCLEKQLTLISERGVPNYFGSQRFGRNGKNMQTAARLFSGENKRLDRHARSMALSSARSWIFNQVISERLQRDDLTNPQIGDALMLSGTQSWFIHDGADTSIAERWRSHDLDITAPMWGKGILPSQGSVQLFEQSVVETIALLPQGLEHQGLTQQRRAIRIVPKDLQWTFPESSVLQLQFSLTRGGFATSVLRELFHC